MARRSFGWAQDASSLESLTRILKVLVPNTAENINKQALIKQYVVDDDIKSSMLKFLNDGKDYPYTLLKGTGGKQMTIDENMKVFGLERTVAEQKTKKGGRANSSCTGIIQISLPAQTKKYDKPYQNDWSAESYLKLGISLNLLTWDSDNDTCNVSEQGLQIALEGDEKKQKLIYINSMMSYPPAVRILQILAKDMTTYTKFDLGSKLGFIGEAGFDSMDIGFYLWHLNVSDKSKRAKARQNKEKMCDKYARMTCSMLLYLGLIETSYIMVSGKKIAGIEYGSERLMAYRITPEGYDAIMNSYGNSSHKQIPRRVLYETLSTAAPDRNYLRYRRANIIRLLQKKKRELGEITQELNNIGIETYDSVVEADIKGLINIGLRIELEANFYTLKDIVEGLTIPETIENKPEVTQVKDRILQKLRSIDKKYIELVDLAFLGGIRGQSNDFEELTTELLITELNYIGAHLGGSNRPDIAVSYKEDGLIIDTKAYEKGFAISAHQRDEMSRYINDNQKRDKSINPNEWWKIFPASVTHFNHLFVSSYFTGQYEKQLKIISADKKEDGACITAENLLYLAEKLKIGNLDYKNVKHLMNNNEIIIDL